jgi:ubiquitin carboxyl-terminal hydrolase 25/28
VLEAAVYGPQWPPPPTDAPLTPEDDIEMVDRPVDKSADTGDDSSEATLVDMDQLPPLIDPTSEKSTVRVVGEGATEILDEKNGSELASAESKEDISGDAVMVNGSISPIDSEMIAPPREKPPPIPPRNKSGLVIQTNDSKKIIADNEFWRFGLQQDVTEVIGNVIFRLQCAIKPISIEAGSGEQIDVIRNTFYGANTTYTQKAESLVKKTDAWSHLMAFPGHDIIRDLYEAIDIVYDEQTVEVENTTCPQYTSISKLPPILQFQIQRTDWTQEKGSFKNRTPVVFPETIHLDRYVDTGDQDSAVMRRRRETWKWKAQLRILEARQAALQNSKGDLAVTEALGHVKEYVRSLQEEEIEGIAIDPALPEALDARISEIGVELEDLATEIASLRKRLQEQFADMRQHEYKLQSVFIHRGESGGGHYWVYIYDFEHDVWREYNDEHVTEVKDRRKIFEDQGAYGNPYFLVYVQSDRITELVDAVCREVVEPEVQMTDVDAWAGQVADEHGDSDQQPESSHIEHANPRPLRPKPSQSQAETQEAWEKNWPPAANENSVDANGNIW